MSQLQKLTQQLDAAPNIKSALALDAVEKIFVDNYSKMTGRKDGTKRLQSEIFALMDIANEKPDILKCDRFSIMAAIVKAGATGLSFQDGKLYPIPYGKTLKVQISTHGKRELMSRMPNVKQVFEGQYVLEGDDFVHDKMNNKVIKHIANGKSDVTLDKIKAAYVRISLKDGSSIDVVVERADILKARSKSKAQNGGPWFDFPGEMAKKVAYNRAYKLYYQKPEGIEDYAREADGDEDTDYSDVTMEAQVSDSASPNVDTSTGEVIEPKVIDNKKDKDEGESFM